MSAEALYDKACEPPAASTPRSISETTLTASLQALDDQIELSSEEGIENVAADSSPDLLVVNDKAKSKLSDLPLALRRPKRKVTVSKNSKRSADSSSEPESDSWHESDKEAVCDSDVDMAGTDTKRDQSGGGHRKFGRSGVTKQQAEDEEDEDDQKAGEIDDESADQTWSKSRRRKKTKRKTRRKIKGKSRKSRKKKAKSGHSDLSDGEDAPPVPDLSMTIDQYKDLKKYVSKLTDDDLDLDKVNRMRGPRRESQKAVVEMNIKQYDLFQRVSAVWNHSINTDDVKAGADHYIRKTEARRRRMDGTLLQYRLSYPMPDLSKIHEQSEWSSGPADLLRVQWTAEVLKRIKDEHSETLKEILDDKFDCFRYNKWPENEVDLLVSIVKEVKEIYLAAAKVSCPDPTTKVSVVPCSQWSLMILAGFRALGIYRRTKTMYQAFRIKSLSKLEAAKAKLKAFDKWVYEELCAANTSSSGEQAAGTVLPSKIATLDIITASSSAHSSMSNQGRSLSRRSTMDLTADSTMDVSSSALVGQLSSTNPVVSTHDRFHSAPGAHGVNWSKFISVLPHARVQIDDNIYQDLNSYYWQPGMMSAMDAWLEGQRSTGLIRTVYDFSKAVIDMYGNCWRQNMTNPKGTVRAAVTAEPSRPPPPKPKKERRRKRKADDVETTDVQSDESVEMETLASSLLSSDEDDQPLLSAHRRGRSRERSRGLAVKAKKRPSRKSSRRSGKSSSRSGKSSQSNSGSIDEDVTLDKVAQNRLAGKPSIKRRKKNRKRKTYDESADDTASHDG